MSGGRIVDFRNQKLLSEIKRTNFGNQNLITEIKRTRQESKQIIILMTLLEYRTVVNQQVLCVSRSCLPE